jgi:lanosterol synthase
MFLLPGLVIASYVSGMEFTTEEKMEMIRYLMNRAHPDDGGWGLCVMFLSLQSIALISGLRHIEGHSTVFGTALNYCVLRILGMDAEHPVAVKARGCLHKLGSSLFGLFVNALMLL